MQHQNHVRHLQPQTSARRSRRRLGRALCALGVVALGCSGKPGSEGSAPGARSQAIQARASEQPSTGKVLAIDELPVIEPVLAAKTFVQRLKEPTEHGENVLVHIELPPPSNGKLEKSLVRVIGEPESPIVLFSSDALEKLGRIEKSPGPGFFTAFQRLEERELERRLDTEKRLGDVQEASKTTLVFRGRTPIAVTTGVHFDLDTFSGGGLIPLGTCPITPASTPERWGESLMITDPEVVQHPDRTHDACTGVGNPDGVWTFKHLMSEMAVGSGLSTHDFVVNWLSRWLRTYTVNGDTVPARRQMFDLVIRPWATRSGVAASLSLTGRLRLSGPLDLDLAPFRLSAIVNRIDLGATSSGPSGYGGATSSQPLDAGELRFVFGVQNLDDCSVLRFSVIFEYGVPITGCRSVRDWAVQWVRLNDPDVAARFSEPWLVQLEGMTESVVRHGAAPGKGNDSALNQIRTNEIALASPWELREFTLSNEDPSTDTNTPASGPLQPHTVAMTPDDGVYAPSHPVLDGFVLGDVLASVPNPIAPLPQGCSASFSVPGEIGGVPFRGGAALTLPPTHWEAAVDDSDDRQVCARHELSLNTCNGCHFGDTDTFFLHVDPTLMPAGLSNFLTGGGGIWSVPDTQFGSPAWPFADLSRRFDRLYEIACNSCSTRVGLLPGILDHLIEINRLVPIDPIGPISRLPFEVGPVESLEVVARLLEARPKFLDEERLEDVSLDGSIGKAQTFVH